VESEDWSRRISQNPLSKREKTVEKWTRTEGQCDIKGVGAFYA
jgi:hypothetical protein